MNIYRGDIFYIERSDTYITVGSEQRAGRPAIVISNDIDNERSNTVQVVYLTSQEKDDRPTHVKVMCKTLSTALCEQLATVARERIGSYVRTCDAEEMAEIDKGLMAALGLKREAAEAEKEEACKDVDMIKLETERDMYKAMYEKLLDKLLK